MVFVGIDWSEQHHDVCVLDADGRVLATGRVPEGVAGVARLHEMVAAHADEADGLRAAQQHAAALDAATGGDNLVSRAVKDEDSSKDAIDALMSLIEEVADQ